MPFLEPDNTVEEQTLASMLAASPLADMAVDPIKDRVIRNFLKYEASTPSDLLLSIKAKDVIDNSTRNLVSGPDPINNQPHLKLSNKDILKYKALVESSPDVFLDYSNSGDNYFSRVRPDMAGPNYSPGGFIVTSNRGGRKNLSLSKHTLLHELGHAQVADSRSGLFRKALGRFSESSRQGLLGKAKSIAPSAYPFLVNPDKPEQIAAALGIQSLLEAPIILEEMAATRAANKALKSLNAAGDISDASRQFAKSHLSAALKTYGAAALPSLLATGVPLALMNDELREKLNPFD
jgi:hypothetical protein